MSDRYIVRANTLEQIKTCTRKILGNRIQFLDNKVYAPKNKSLVFTGLIISKTSNFYDLTYEVQK